MATQLPGVKEGGPINVRHEPVEGESVERPNAGEDRLGKIRRAPVDRPLPRARLLQGQERLLRLAVLMCLANPLLVNPIGLGKGGGVFPTE